MEQLDALWTTLLDVLAQVITPAWGDLLQYIPLLLFLLMGALSLVLLRAWARTATIDRPRTALRRPPGRVPAGVHLPGPSAWPFLAAIGLGLTVFTIGVGFSTSIVNLVLLGIGILAATVGLLGWLADASREYHLAEAGHVASATQRARLAHGGGPPSLERTAPEGLHLPGPSAWPFLAPIGLAIAVLGLVFGAALLIGGSLLATIAALGWARDAGREYRQVEAHGHLETGAQAGARVFPRSVGPVFASVIGVALVITLLPPLVDMLPGAGSSNGGAVGPEPTDTPYLSAISALEFEQSEIAVFADRPFRLTFENKQEGVPHNVAIYDSAERNVEYYLGEIFNGPDTRVYEVPALAAGTYFFVCSVHPPMTGTLYSR